ncbi:hypothetical protein PIB30_023696 [Stylosanthes scabra]|uniref:F-box associated beta-propeller type 3 domain-containing protein n=1 Tax=Stylosanthes scabra TaxID=79078 RepID=A0ABU6UCC3_9FABA|nr:hypothetical protein [Stylosanthes scabra]
MLRLLVKSLQQFRSACKPWNALILSNCKFIMEQLHRAFAPCWDCRDLLVYVHSFPDEALTSYLRGKIFLSPSLSVPSKTFQGSPVLWNPTTMKFKILPQIKKYPMDTSSVHTRLGHDPSSDSDKVVEVLHSKGVNTAMVHIVGTDLWGEIKNFSDLPPFNVKFVNDIPYWIVKRSIFMVYHLNSSVIISSDMGRKEFHEVKPSMSVIGDLNLSLLKSWLCIVGRRFMNSEVWVMKEYGNDEFWTKFFIISIYEENHHSRPFYNIIHCISEDDENAMYNIIKENRNGDSLRRWK